MDSLYIVMPAYNEEQNIETVVRQWYPLLDGKAETSRLVVADSGSTDHTHEILERLKENGFTKLEILSNTNKFHGPKLIALYNYAIRNKISYVFQTDSDGQTNPKEFDAFWKNRELYAGIFGNRETRGDGKSRAFIEKVVCILLRLYFGVCIPDANAPFRLMKTETMKKYLYLLPEDFNIPNIMITTFYAYYHEEMQFREITFKPRRAGKNSINIRKIVIIGQKALKDFYIFRSKMRQNDKVG